VIGGAAATLAAVSIVPRHVLGGPGQHPEGTRPSEKLNVAGIGIGGVGRSFLRGCDSQNIIALCDVDHQYAAPVFNEYPAAKQYRDYREMLDKQPEIDAVVVATPDHSHAVISLHAIKLGKHVLCVKPLTRTIHESRTLAEAARKAKVATQVTASSRASESALRLCEMIWDGAIGPVREAHCWSNRPLWPQGMDCPAGEDKVPDHLDWDLWIGPAPMRPFKNVWPEGHLALKQVGASQYKGVYHPWNFRGWWDFGTGALGDMGCHHFNALFKALKLGHPTSVEASSTRALPETAPLASVVTWEFPAREDMPPLRLTWSDGGIKPPRPGELEAGRPWPDEGNLYVGQQGQILGGTNDGRIIPDEKMKAYRLPPKTLPRPAFPGNLVTAEWIAACQGGQPASCNFDVADLLTEVALLGNIAIRTGKKLSWDAEQMKFTNDEDANKYIREPYRSGWSL
jgi:predicted dehydrogenase